MQKNFIACAALLLTVGCNNTIAINDIVDSQTSSEGHHKFKASKPKYRINNQLISKTKLNIGTGFYTINRGSARKNTNPYGNELFNGSTKTEFGARVFGLAMLDNIGCITELEFGIGPGISPGLRESLGINDQWLDCSTKGNHGIGIGVCVALIPDLLNIYVVSGTRFVSCVCEKDHSGNYLAGGVVFNLGSSNLDIALLSFNGDRTVDTRGSGVVGLDRTGVRICYNRCWAVQFG